MKKEDSIIQTAIFDPKKLSNPNAWVGHMPFANWLMRNLKPRVFVELGTHTGNSYFSFCHSVLDEKLHTKCYAVDTWKGDEHAGNYGDEVFEDVKKYNDENYSEYSTLIRSTFDQALANFPAGSIDLLHIDGLHTYEAVKHDFESWYNKVSADGFVLFHDICVKENNFGVWILWEELKKQYPNNFEFHHSYGLGVLSIKTRGEDSIINELKSDKDLYQKLFQAFGDNQNNKLFLKNTKQQLSEKESVIAEKEGVIAEKEGVIAEKEGVIAEKEGVIAEKEGVIAEKEGVISNFREDITLREEKIQELLTQVNKKECIITQKEKLIKELENQLLEKKEAFAGLYSEFKGLRASMSCKVTRQLLYLVTKQYSALQRLRRHWMGAWLIWNHQKSGIFDSSFYEQCNPDIKSSGINPWIHFALHGVYEGRAPNAQFITTNYLDLNPDVARSGIAPVLHYMIHGFREGRVVQKEIYTANISDKTPDNSADSTKKLMSYGESRRIPMAPKHPVVVIVPIYRGIDFTQRCIESAMPGVLEVRDARLLAINDASPEEGMDDMLTSLKARWDRLDVIKNDNNLGFVKTVNRGIERYPNYDVVLLNSDVIVPSKWLGRLQEEAYSCKNAGTVTPFSNNATICSFPYFLQENIQEFNLEVNEIDKAFKIEKLPCITAPTGVGFCMYIRRDCLNQIGLLNEKEFGKGYGEENDLCQRGLKNGWINLITPNLYAFHEGGGSFTIQKKTLIDKATGTLDRLHPEYYSDVKRFIDSDPVKNVRLARYIQLISNLELPKVLHIMHSAGGGVKQHIEELSEPFSNKIKHLLITPGKDGSTIILSFGIDTRADKLEFKIPVDYNDLVELLKIIGITSIHYHHTHLHNRKLLKLNEDLGVTRIITVHDYYWISANPTLTDKQGVFYKEHIHTSGNNELYSLPEGMAIERWQNLHRSFINDADVVIFPSWYSRNIFKEVYNPVKEVVVGHIENKRNINQPPKKFVKKSHYNIGVIGALGKEKGADLLEKIALALKKETNKFKIKLLGYAYRPLSGLNITGPYIIQDLKELIKTSDLDVIFFPATWPETYSYTLSYAIESGLPIFAPNIGAFPERLSGRSGVSFFEYNDSVEKILGKFKTFIHNLERGIPSMAAIIEFENRDDNFYSNNYEAITSCGINRLKEKVEPRTDQILHLVKKATYSCKNNKRIRFGHFLWKIRMNNRIKWIVNSIPRPIRRKLKSFCGCSSEELALGNR